MASAAQGVPVRTVQEGDVVVAGEVDRVYSSDATVEVHDPVLDRVVQVAKEGSGTTVVWNPWQEKGSELVDLAEGGVARVRVRGDGRRRRRRRRAGTGCEPHRRATGVGAMSGPGPRPAQERLRDTLHRLRTDVDGWVATASPDGVACMVPLSFRWDGATFLLGTPASSPTARNVVAGSRVRIGIGATRDVVLVEGTGTQVEPDDDEAQAFADQAGFDPRLSPGYAYLRITPHLVQAWREADELRGRDLMKGGRWLVEQAPADG